MDNVSLQEILLQIILFWSPVDGESQRRGLDLVGIHPCQSSQSCRLSTLQSVRAVI